MSVIFSEKHQLSFIFGQGQDPSIVAWKGGSVLSCLDGAQELWISQKNWKAHGLRLLREQSPFVW